MVTVEEARHLIATHVSPVAVETTPILAALGRVVASPVVAPIALPPFDNSAMDGFAVRAADLVGAAGMAVILPVAGTVAAGSRLVPPLPPGRAMRIMTGAPLPAGADAVVPWEEASEADGQVSLPTRVQAGAHVRRAGEDVARGARVLEAGQPLNASRIALLAALGRATAIVYAPLRVAIVSTGDELAEPGTPLAAGQIYDSNAYALMAAVAEAGGQPLRVKAASDDPDEIKRALARALCCDVVITTGGVSKGDFDHVGETLASLGRVHFKEVAQQPGKPFTFATIRGKPVFGLPGNPVAAAVCFEVYIRPALRRMMGHTSQERPRVLAIAAEPYEKRMGRQVFLRAKIAKSGPVYHARLAGPQGSAMMGAMAAANGLVVVPADSRGFRPGDLVETILLEPPELCGMACLAIGAPSDAISASVG